MPHDDELSALMATPVILAKLLEMGWESRPSGEEGWTSKEVLAHLRDAEEIRLLRCRRMRDDEAPIIEGFDQEVLARERDYGSTDAVAALETFQCHRHDVVDLLSALDDASWERDGRHEELGRITIESHIRHAISHDLVHVRQIDESLTPPLR